MTDIEKIEMARYYGELEDDLNHLLRKYCRIMGWEVPDLDEQEARTLILEAMRNAIAEMDKA